MARRHRPIRLNSWTVLIFHRFPLMDSFEKGQVVAVYPDAKQTSTPVHFAVGLRQRETWMAILSHCDSMGNTVTLTLTHSIPPPSLF